MSVLSAFGSKILLEDSDSKFKSVVAGEGSSRTTDIKGMQLDGFKGRGGRIRVARLGGRLLSTVVFVW